MGVGGRRRGGQRQDQEGAGRTSRGAGEVRRDLRPARGRPWRAAPVGPPLLLAARVASRPPHLTRLSGRGRPSAAGRGTRRQRRLRGPARAGLPWLLWGLARAVTADQPPPPPTCPGRHVGRKRRVTQGPNGCREGSGGGGRGSGAPCPELPRRREVRGGGRRRRSARAAALRWPGGASPPPAFACRAARGVAGASSSSNRLRLGTEEPPVPMFPLAEQDSQLPCIHFSDFLY